MGNIGNIGNIVFMEQDNKTDRLLHPSELRLIQGDGNDIYRQEWQNPVKVQEWQQEIKRLYGEYVRQWQQRRQQDARAALIDMARGHGADDLQPYSFVAYHNMHMRYYIEYGVPMEHVREVTITNI